MSESSVLGLEPHKTIAPSSIIVMGPTLNAVAFKKKHSSAKITAMMRKCRQHPRDPAGVGHCTLRQIHDMQPLIYSPKHLAQATQHYRAKFNF